MPDIPFESFASIIYRLSHPPKSKSPSTTSRQIPPEKIFVSWLNHLPKPFGPGTGKHLFRLLFPHEGSRRRYGLKETLLARELGKILCVEGLARWDCVRWEGEAGTGCLGKEVELIMREKIPAGTRSTLSIRDIDTLLDALASPSAFSQLSQPPLDPLTPSQILIKLYRDSSLSPYSLSVLTQIILRDLRPLLDPLPQLPIRNPTAMLRLKSTAGPAQLELLPAMRAWSGKMAEMYRAGVGSLDVCADAVEQRGDGPGGVGPGVGIPAGPVVGINVQIPKCRKGRSVEDALNEFCGNQYTAPASVVWAETKYDGYRVQIHVEIRNNQPIITIFSKSKRNSTMDRYNAHSIILASLGLPVTPHLPQHPALSSRTPISGPSLRRSIILEAEVVPFNEGQRDGARGPGIEEFWHLDAAGVTAGSSHASRAGPSRLPDCDRHLCLAYFDILHLNGTSLLGTSYAKRRELLESTIRPIKGFSVICDRTPIPLHLGRSAALTSLQSAFDRACLGREEGLVLKSAESTYNSAHTHRWVKLKKDYIPNMGDCIDLVLLGAGWDADRARELRVDTSVFTTFYVGALVNGDKVRKRQEGPHFEVLFRVSYGSSRDELELYNTNIRLGRWGTKPFDRDDPYKKRLLGLSWTYYVPRSMPPPSVLFEQPLCAEIMGAGFQKLPWSNLYEIRWPRLQKIFESRERPWSEALDGPHLIHAAHVSLGYSAQPALPVLSPEYDSVRNLWRSASNLALDVLPDTPSPERRQGLGAMTKRNKSAPDLLDVLKTSPPTPRPPSPAVVARASPLRTPDGARMRVTDLGERMRQALLASPECVTTARSPLSVGRTAHLGTGPQNPHRALPITPRSSPLRSKRLASPLFTPSPVKRPRSALKRNPAPVMLPIRRDPGTFMAQDSAGGNEASHIRTPAPSSPVLGEMDLNTAANQEDAMDCGCCVGSKQPEVADAAVGIGTMPICTGRRGVVSADGRFSKARNGGRPLSLRSRIKLVLRGMAR